MMLQGVSEAVGLSVPVVMANEGQHVVWGASEDGEQGQEKEVGDDGEPTGKAQSKAGREPLLLCPPGELVVVREEIRPKGYSSQGALRASDKGVQEHSRKRLAGLTINGLFEHKRNINT